MKDHVASIPLTPAPYQHVLKPRHRHREQLVVRVESCQSPTKKQRNTVSDTCSDTHLSKVNCLTKIILEGYSSSGCCLVTNISVTWKSEGAKNAATFHQIPFFHVLSPDSGDLEFRCCAAPIFFCS